MADTCIDPTAKAERWTRDPETGCWRWGGWTMCRLQRRHRWEVRGPNGETFVAVHTQHARGIVRLHDPNAPEG